MREAIARVDPDDLHLHGWLHERLGRYLWMSADTRHALASYERAVALVPEEPPTRRRAAVLSGLSQVLMLAGRYEESEALARQAIAVAARIPDGRAVEGHARCNLGVDLAYTGRLEEGVAELREALRIAEEYSDDVDDIARALVNLSSILYDHGPLEEAAEGGAGQPACDRQPRAAAWQGSVVPLRRSAGADAARAAFRGGRADRRGAPAAATGHRSLPDRPG